MLQKIILALVAGTLCFTSFAQSGFVSGPMLGPVELRDAKVWCEPTPDISRLSIRYWKEGTDRKLAKQKLYKGELGNEFNPVQFSIGGLDINTTYNYEIEATNSLKKNFIKAGKFTTKDLWQWRKPAPDFSFLTGGCAYTNQPEYDRPGRPYGGDSSIFESMAKEKAAFMLWTGDAWYTREVDYYSEWGLWYRASHDRAAPVLQNFLKAMPQFGMWDDHDYGPNDIGKNYILKEASRTVFNKYFCNPSAGENGQGIYTMTSWGDMDLFMMDDRWWRSADEMKDSINGLPNPDKTMWGKMQMEWLKNSLLYSKATFKIIATGSQVLNPVSPFDKLLNCPAEYYELMNFLKEYKINGVVFLTGDRHHSEVIKVDRPGTYSLYDVTVSPLTSGTHKFSGPEKNNPYRVFGLGEKQNYGRFSISGKRNERKLTVEFLGVKGEKLGEWSVKEDELKSPK